MLATVRRSLANKAEVLIEFVGLVISALGATFALALGRLMLALILGMVVLGFFFRLTGRRRVARKVLAPEPAWIYIAASTAAVIEVTLLVEATQLPVRFYQEGFSLLHWAIVLAALVVAFWLQIHLLRSFTSHRCERQDS